jgi:hypothetical protein
MRKTVSLVVVLFYSLLPHVVAQNQAPLKDKIEYKGQSVYTVILGTTKDGEVKVLDKLPMGKNPMLTFDTFFKNWSIAWVNEKNEVQFFDLTYVRQLDNGLVKMKDEHGNYYTVNNRVDKDGSLVLLPENKSSDYNIEIMGLVRISK